MAKTAKPDIDAVLGQQSLIDAAVREGAREAIQIHQQLGHLIPVLRDGKVVHISAEEALAAFDESATPVNPSRREAV